MTEIPLIDPPVQSMTLRDGRCLTWQEFGAPQGRPALYFHGGGGTSHEAGLFHREAVQRDIRLIATNRPGVVGATLCPGRPVAAYSHDLEELLAALRVERFACFGESNGGMVTLAVAATLSSRVVGAVPINPTVPWFDPLARSVTPCAAAVGYRLIRYWPGAVVSLTKGAADRVRRMKAKPGRIVAGFDKRDLLGPPPGTEPDIADLQWRHAEHGTKAGLRAELIWAGSDWGFDYYAIPVELDFFCGVYDAQGAFALVLADRNPCGRFHYFAYGHSGFSHPDARRRILDTVAGYFGS